MFNNNIKTGRTGEKIASDYLLNQGYKIIERNWHYSKNAEIDIIAEKEKILVFIEVKTRKSLNYGHQFKSITSKKIQKIHKAITAYMSEKKVKYKSYRFDAIAIIGLTNPIIEHIKDIGQF